ncbi:MAG: carboxypeptidase regulatory-like domain-containing protein [Myxococcales bacterium]|nr:carboxypeptidase regulatory-like domain-containing protein [Myxococcales bacterium]
MSRRLPLVSAVLALLLGVLVGTGSAWAQPEGRPDPRQMSGIPRPDPQIPAGEVTVRVLLGGFDEPALDAVVSLELRSADGRRAALRTAEAGNQGRAYFRDLGDFAGGQAVALTVLDGETIRSQQIDLRADAGTAVMLVKGAPKRSPTQEVSLPGIVFDFPKAAPGSLMVGVFDLQSRKGLVDTEVQLVATGPDGQASTTSKKTGPTGQASFEGMDQLAPGTVVHVEAQLDAEGEPYRSQSFTPDPSKGQAVVLARGRMAAAGGNPHEAGGPPSRAAEGGQRTRLPPPMVGRDLPVGTVQVMVVDGSDAPVAGQEIELIKKDFSGTEERFTATTDQDGVATRADLPLAINDGLYYVGVPYDGAPYTSPFFALDKRGGVRVAMRVWPVTDDPKVAKSAVQWEVVEVENDEAVVVQVYEVLVSGDRAFWPGPGMRLEGAPGTKGLVVMGPAEDWLDHDDEKAPFVTLAHPIPPGEVANLSFRYVLAHDGEIELEWTPPFEVVQSAVILSDEHTLDAPGATISERELNDQPGLDYVRVPYELGQKGFGAVRFTVSGLRRTDPRFRWIGLVGGSLLGLVLVLGLVMRPRGDARARLQRRRDELLAALEAPRTKAQRERIIAALDQVYRQLDVLDERAAPGKRA